VRRSGIARDLRVFTRNKGSATCVYSLESTKAIESYKSSGRISLSTVVPAVKKNSQELIRLMQSIQAVTVPPDEVVIAMSGVGDDDGNLFCDTLLHKVTTVLTRSPIKLACLGEMLLAGPARNNGFMSSRSELISFMDADDAEFPIRNEVSKNIFACIDATV